MSTFSFVAGDDVARSFYLLADGVAQSITGATCVLHWSSDDRQADRATSGTHALALIGDGSTGGVTLTMTDTESSAFAAGGYHARIVVTFAGGLIQSFPLDANAIEMVVLAPL